MHPLDPWHVAHMLMQQHGENAGLQAATRVDELNAAGDEEGRRVRMQSWMPLTSWAAQAGNPARRCSDGPANRAGLRHRQIVNGPVP